jgi:hypothetical protein
MACSLKYEASIQQQMSEDNQVYYSSIGCLLNAYSL